MKKVLGIVLVVSLALVLTTFAARAEPPVRTDSNGVETAWTSKNNCATIQGGTITDAAGNPISVGFDQYGYNYQAHMFNGTYDSWIEPGWLWGSTGDYVDDNLSMKWSDALVVERGLRWRWQA